jgi:hypothetical protein
MKTTLNAIREHGLCPDKLAKLLRYLGKTNADDEPLAITTILDSNGLDDALWCLRAVTGHDREIRLYAVWCARQVQHLITDPRSLAALDVAERYAGGYATADDLAAAWDAAREASWASARAAMATAPIDAATAARNAAMDASWNTTLATRNAARNAQSQRLRYICAEVESAE